MKLTDLTEQDKIKLAAELDGFGEAYQRKRLGPLWMTCFSQKTLKKLDTHSNEMDKSFYKEYSASYDAIIRLIQKLSYDVQSRVYDKLPVSADLAYTRGEVGSFIFNCTPSQLLDAVLVATGKAEL